MSANRPMDDPHAGQPVYQRGSALDHRSPMGEEASAALIMLHGRGANAADMLQLAETLQLTGVAVLTPQAAGGVWYPQPFTAPVQYNEPWLSSALGVIDALIERLQRAGVAAERTGLLGFSQGACLALEYAARHPQRYAGVFALSGGLIGEPGRPRDVEPLMDGTPVFLGCSDRDPYIPLALVEEAASVFERLGAQVDKRIYPNMGHSVNEDEMQAVRAVMAEVTRRQ